MVIEARGLSKRFGKTVALDDIDLNIQRGSAFGILGPAGSGKSTLVRVLAGLARPSGGTLTIDGAAGGSVASRRRLGVLLQDAQLYPWMTGRDALAFAATLGGVANAAVAARIEDVAGRLSIADVLDKRVATLPLPTRRRLATGQALVAESGIVVLDEPFLGLDREGRDEVISTLRELRGRRTIVLAAHRPADIEVLCDRMAVLEGGRIVRTSAVTKSPPKPARQSPAAPAPAAVATETAAAAPSVAASSPAAAASAPAPAASTPDAAAAAPPTAASTPASPTAATVPAARTPATPKPQPRAAKVAAPSAPSATAAAPRRPTRRRTAVGAVFGLVRGVLRALVGR